IFVEVSPERTLGRFIDAGLVGGEELNEALSLRSARKDGALIPAYVNSGAGHSAIIPPTLLIDHCRCFELKILAVFQRDFVDSSEKPLCAANNLNCE
ncbi:hypothetical protein KI387_021396, partial [Taxus chinensis]